VPGLKPHTPNSKPKTTTATPGGRYPGAQLHRHGLPPHRPFRRVVARDAGPPYILRDFGIFLPNNQRQHRTSHIQKDVLPYALCQLLCPVSAALASSFWDGFDLHLLLRGLYSNLNYFLLHREVTDYDGICEWLFGSF